MNKSYFIALASLFLTIVGSMQAQQLKQKIGNNPYKITQPDAVLEIESTNKGVLLPRVALTATTSPAPLAAHVAGMVVYNTATAGDVTPGQYTNNGTAWVKNEATKTVGQDVVSDCTANGFSTVNLVKGVAASGLNFTVSLTNNTLSSAGPLGFTTGDLVLSGANAGLTVSGVNPTTASITPGLSQVVTYTITGTPTTNGVLTGKWKKLSLACENTRNVDGTLVAALNCAGATFNTAFTDNTASYFTKIVLPYTGGNGGGYTAQTLSSTGVTGMTATLAAGNLAVGAGNLTFTVSGTPSASGNADFSVSIGGKTCTVSLNVWSFSTTNQGATAAQASRSCNAIKLANASATDGTYYIDIDGVDGTYTAQQAYCDMTNDGGGWTLVARWDQTPSVSVVTSLNSIATIGQWSDATLKKLFSFSANVRIHEGSSPTALTALGISSSASLLSSAASTLSLGTPQNYIWTGALGSTIPPLPALSDVPFCAGDPTCMSPHNTRFVDAGTQRTTNTGLAFNTYTQDTARVTDWSRDVGCGSGGVTSGSGSSWTCAQSGVTWSNTLFGVASPVRSAYRAVWLK